MILSLGITPKSYFIGGASNDADAQAFIDAAGITDATQQSAVNQLVLDIKSANIWTKMKAIYPIVGGSASTHKWNLKDPRDLDAAYRLAFGTGMTHSSNGFVSNGTSGFANTYLTPNSHLTNNNTHLSVYSRTNLNIAAASFDIGTSNNVTAFYDLSLRVGDTIYSDSYNNSTNRFTTANTDSRGLFTTTRTSSTVLKIFKNNSQLGSTLTAASTNFSSLTQPIYICALNKNGAVDFYTTRQYAFASIGDGLTDTEAANLYTAVNTFQTTLGRNV
jgi:hypothetical protein